MISFSHPFVLLLAVPLIAATVLIWRNGYVNLSARRRWASLAVRLLLLFTAVLGFAGAGLSLPQSRQATVFVADLSASDAGLRSDMRTLINQAVGRRPGDDQAGIVSVGRQALVEQPVSPLAKFEDFQSSVNGDYTNLEGGLELANAILPDGYRKRVLIMSDGQQNVGDAISAARLLRSQGVRVDVIPVHVQGGPEVLVDAVHAPAQLRPRERFSIVVSLHSSVDTTTGLDISHDGTLVLSRQVPVHAGENQYTFDESPLSPGFHSYQIHITPAADTQLENNSGSVSMTVQGPPRVLVIATHRSEAANVVASLRTTGIQADFQLPTSVVPTLAYLQRYAAVVIVDTAADVLGPDLTSQLIPFVRDLGHGLVVLGGQEAFGMGGYGQTPLEKALPVKMDLPKRKDLPSAAVSLVIEDLESPMPVNISKEAGKGVVNLLTQQDQVAVNDTPFDSSSGWAVPLQHVTNKNAIDHAIDAMSPGDPMSYAPYLRSSYQALRHTNARARHIILLGDGDAEDSGYEQLVKHIRAGGVTVSTVATNGMGYADFQTMQNIARWGGGRYYRADNTASIPKIFLREARTVARSGIITGKFFPSELSANPMLRDVHAIPPLYGYVATTPKATGEMVLVSRKLDPVLAGWQFGLGRSVAWTSDAAGLWTKDWLQAPGANRFWANLVSWTLPAANGSHLFISAGSSQGQGRISVNTSPSLGADPNVTARVLGPDLHQSSVQLQPAAPGRFHGSFLANAQGPYFITVEARGAGHADAGQAGLDIPYSAEYRTTGTNMPFLRALARAGGGSVVTPPQAAWADNLSSVFAQHDLTSWLALLTLVLLPIDVATRRLTVSRRDLAAIWASIPFHSRYDRSEEPAIAPLGAVRARRASSQPATHAASTISPPPSGEVRIKPSVATKPRPAQPSDGPAPARPTEESTTSRLLAARKRKK